MADRSATSTSSSTAASWPAPAPIPTAPAMRPEARKRQHGSTRASGASTRLSSTVQFASLRGSGFAGHGDLEGLTNLAHPLIAEAAETLDQRCQRDALHRIEVDDRGPWDRILAWLEQH